MLKNKHIVVTGAGRGLGRAMAWELAKCGARVGLNYFRSEKAANQLWDEIKASGAPEPVLLPFDATQKAQVEEGLACFLKVCPRIDGWVNNAACNLPGLLPMLSEKEIRAQLDSALMGPILCCQAVIPHMLTERQGAILNIGSISAEKVFRGQSIYAAAKGGLVSFTKALAFEYARKGIRVNCLQPGPVDTDMFRQTDSVRADDFISTMPQGHLVGPQGVASMAAYLLSDRACDVTGTVVNVDGGYSL